MNCTEVESLICDYVDDTLAAAERTAVESHMAACPNCAELARDSAVAVAFMERAEVVEPPQELISHILFNPPWHGQRVGWFSRVLHPLLAPRFAMGMALTVLSFAMIMPKMRQFQPTDLSPAVVWAGIEGRVDRLWGRTEKFYDNLKFIYQIRATLREWQQQSAETRPQSGSSSMEQHRVPAPNVDGNGGKQ
ncbi:MAG TPA: zf-HC2 domain-containing protein [Bryobacteraceae bacterium]|jgi:hypothetical protein